MSDLEITPLVSIIITSFNRAKWIEKAIESALNQDYPNIEIIISDNHSTDNSDSIIQKYTHNQKIKYYVNETNIGMIPNFKLATEKRANGKYITYVSSDDYFCNNKFVSNAISLINKGPDIVLVAAKNSTFYENSNQFIQEDTDHIYRNEFMLGKDVFKLFPKWFSPGWGGVLMCREKLIKTNIFESKAQSMDYEANLKLMLQGNLAFIREPTYVFRRHTSQASSYMTIEAQINNLDFIENTYYFAKKIDIDIDIEEWRQEIYISYLNAIARRLIKRKVELKNLMRYVKYEKKVRLNFLKNPKIFLLFIIYNNYEKISYLLKLVYPNLYHSIERDIN